MSSSRREIAQRDLDQLEESSAEHLSIAQTVLDWTDPQRFELVAPLTERRLLIVAAEHYRLAGSLDEALESAERAREASFDAHPALVGIHLDRGDRDAALELADEARKAGVSSQLAQQLGEAFELGGELAAAERWYVIALRDASEGDRADILLGRYRVRRDAGKPTDVLDAETEQLAAARGRRLG